ncbi:uncharacterized protein Tco025E_06258 [Trypanosoma conorhini]|uniref:Uncharacterized protein n=1 Tax=Trypanosoma conorhini TaxID=83891 RepID=A0A422P6U6_9TRYP|nr:uncharacterized protein Tco025E_06258 [Trypanosoma conorhini]RNF13440.1 hypothetical protein Tco025E_06258 [Trypanosoma conorhini]
MTFKRAFPPRCLPSRRATSHAATPPEVPKYRACSRGHCSPHTPRFRVPPLSPPPSAASQQQQQQKQELREAEKERGCHWWCGIQELFGSNGCSPLPKLPPHASFAELQHPAPSAGEVDEEHTPHRHFYREGGDDANGDFPVKLVAFSIYNSLTVTGLVEVVPCRWRLNANPSLYPLQLQIREMDATTYPMRRLLRLIQKTVTGGGSDGGTGVSPRQQPMKGSLYISKRGNPHLQFLSGLPNIIPLSGSVVLADVVMVDQIPINGAAVRFRWVEDPSRRVLVDIDTLPSGGDVRRDSADEAAVQYYARPSSDFVPRTCQEHDGSGCLKQVNAEAEENNSRAAWPVKELDGTAFLKSADGKKMTEYIPHVITDRGEEHLSMLHANATNTDGGSASPITYLHTPYMR